MLNDCNKEFIVVLRRYWELEAKCILYNKWSLEECPSRIGCSEGSLDLEDYAVYLVG
jgi:hypothetical protein